MSHVLERVISHRLLKVDGIEYFYLISTPLEHLTAFLDHCTFRVLSIRIEKKVNYFFEVTVSD